MNFKNFFWNTVLAPGRIKKLHYLTGAIVDPKGLGFLQLMLENANVPEKYRYMFVPDEENAVFIDCGMNVGLISDIARLMDMVVYGFEPNPQAIRLLNKKYSDDDNVKIYPKGVSNKNGEMGFYINKKSLFDQGATLSEEGAKFLGDKTEYITVEVVRLVDIIRNDILKKHSHIHLLKIDIEGAEFDLLDDLIDENIHEFCNYIVVETHERFFKNGKERLRTIQKKINDKHIENIFLDWV